MVKPKLETELHNGYANFDVIGHVMIDDNTFPQEESKSASGYVYKRASFLVKADQSSSMYVQLMGGHREVNPQVWVRNKNGEMTPINWEMRDKEEVLNNVDSRSFMRVGLEKGEDGKLIVKQFVAELDLLNYLAEHLDNNMYVEIKGNVEYSRYNGNIQRHFNIRSVFLRNENKVKPKAIIEQTYLLDEHSLPRKWEDTLVKNGKMVVNAFVPQYVSKENGKVVKKTVAMPQTFTFTNGTDKRIQFIKRFLQANKGEVIEATMRMNVVYGVEESTGNVEITKELQELIDLGIMTEEEAESELTVGSQRVDETQFFNVVLNKQTGKPRIQVRYDPSALIVWGNEDEEVSVDDAFAETDTESADNSEDDVFNDDELFG